MKREEHKTALQKLLAMIQPDKQGEASEILTALSDDYEKTLTTSEGHATRVEELTRNNETLRRVNSDLFLKVGSTVPTPNPVDKEQPTEPDPAKLSFDKLFNDKGELI